MNHDEIANILENVYGRKKGEDIPIVQASLKAAADERKIASGEYVQVVHGRWIQRECEDELLATCSECGYPVSWWHKTSHCPSCGTLMKGKDGDHHAE